MAEAAIITDTQEPAICIDSAAWGAAMMRFRMAELRFENEWSAFVALDNDHEDRPHWVTLIDQSSDELGAARKALLNMPAPHQSALRWKLDQVITFEGDEDDEFMEAWSRTFVQQTINDYRRLLPA